MPSSSRITRPSLLMLMMVMLGIAATPGCSGESNVRPTLDYAPENVEGIREAQQLNPPGVSTELQIGDATDANPDQDGGTEESNEQTATADSEAGEDGEEADE